MVAAKSSSAVLIFRFWGGGGGCCWCCCCCGAGGALGRVPGNEAVAGPAVNALDTDLMKSMVLLVQGSRSEVGGLGSEV